MGKIRRLELMNEYVPNIKKNIPSDVVLYICGDNNVSLHFSPQGNILSVDYDTLSYLPEYENRAAGEFVTGVSS